MTLTQIKPAGLSKPVDFADNEQIRLGTGNDLLIYHNGTSSEIESATGSLRLHGAQNQAIIFRNHDDTANVAVFNVDDATHLYYDSAHKFSTNSTGIRVVGNCIPGSNDSGQLGTSSIRWQELNITDVIDVSDNGKIRMGDSDDLQIYHDGSNGNSHINESGSGSLVIKATNTYINNSADEQMIAAIADGAVELYHDNSKKLETTSDGVQVNGDFKIDNPVNAGDDIFFDASENWMRWDDNVKIQCGNSGDLEIYHDGTSNYIKSISGILKLISPSNTNTEIIVDSDEIAIHCIADGGVELYHNDSKKFETTSAGATLTGHLNIAAGNVEFASGNGIDFSAVSDGSRSVSTDGNKLDDYEEGTWTPSLHFGGNTTGITYNNREGSYTKIGRQVTLNWMIDLSSKGSATGDARIYAMPFATANLLTTTSVEANGISAYWNNFEPDLYYMAFFADHAYISIRSQDGNGLSDALNEMTNSDFANNSTFRGSITYFTAT